MNIFGLKQQNIVLYVFYAGLFCLSVFLYFKKIVEISLNLTSCRLDVRKVRSVQPGNGET